MSRGAPPVSDRWPAGPCSPSDGEVPSESLRCTSLNWPQPPRTVRTSLATTGVMTARSDLLRDARLTPITNEEVARDDPCRRAHDPRAGTPGCQQAGAGQDSGREQGVDGDRDGAAQPRNRVGSTGCCPPHANLPSGAPNARSAWNTAQGAQAPRTPQPPPRCSRGPPWREVPDNDGGDHGATPFPWFAFVSGGASSGLGSRPAAGDLVDGLAPGGMGAPGDVHQCADRDSCDQGQCDNRCSGTERPAGEPGRRPSARADSDSRPGLRRRRPRRRGSPARGSTRRAPRSVARSARSGQTARRT